MKYSEKLKDPRWQRKRLEIMDRDEFTCQNCGDSKSTLNVHHKQYHGNPWDAPDDSLETLCERCHEKRTALNKSFLSLPTNEAMLMDRFIVHTNDGSAEADWDMFELAHKIKDIADRHPSFIGSMRKVLHDVINTGEAKNK